MRVPEQLLQNVVFIAEIEDSPSGDSPDWYATGFITAMPTVETSKTKYPLLVTAKHVALGLKDRKIGFFVNKKGGGLTELSVPGGGCFFHPTDDSVDVAVFPCVIPPDADIRVLTTDRFIFLGSEGDPSTFGIGDEVFFPGLFTYAPGSKRNMPILRHGNLAMIPEEPIQVAGGFAEVYLIEARSIGGISGSPVFIRPTMGIDESRLGIGDKTLLGISSEVRLLGLMHGHWDILESDMNKANSSHNRRGVNMGIGVVVPARKILETINSPSLLALRDANEEKHQQRVRPTPDSL
jgi:hypothetical protein